MFGMLSHTTTQTLVHTEWLAFHYHTVNLTHLIITIDPDSLTKPTRVLDRWRDRITIEEWDDSKFLPHDWRTRVKRKTDPGKSEDLVGHRFRQAHFNLACLEALKRANRGWTLMIDTDEYLFPNPDVYKTDVDEEDDEYLPSMEKPGSTLEVLNRLLIPHPDFDELHRPCIPVFRHQFSARESSDEQVFDMVPEGFDAKAFQTLRWRKFGYNEIRRQMKWGNKCSQRRWVPNKVIIDLGRLRLQDITHNPENSGNPHVPLDICPENLYVPRKQTPVITNHYMGRIDQWLYRQGDKRGTVSHMQHWMGQAWASVGSVVLTIVHTFALILSDTCFVCLFVNLYELFSLCCALVTGIGYRLARYEDLNAMIGTEETDQARPWLKGFVESVGKDEALRLLDGVGVLDPLPGVTPTLYDHRLNDTHEVFELGEVIQADYQGDGDWGWAEITAVHELAKGFYNVIYAGDCSEEIGTFADRIRRKDNTTEGLDHIPYFQKLKKYHEATEDDDENGDDRIDPK
jgi:hypothetical protein